MIEFTYIMKRRHDLSPDERKDAFLDTLAEVQDEFDQKGIDYRIIGSLASHAYLDANHNDIPPLNFNRKGAATPDQQVPDIDLIVPRADLAGAREVRTKALTKVQPVKLGLANPTTEIDFRPDEDTSFLTHKDVILPVDSDLFSAEEAKLEQVPIQTVPINTLVHTFGTFGGRVRQKDVPIIKALIREGDSPVDPRTKVFHDFQLQRRKRSPGEHRRSLVIEAVTNKAPARLRNEFYRAALVAADILKMR